ncbi:FliA/WhiG family RNA polymerase sigma factor [Acididesulfobacillus acetoxydans]|uniref:FliA/WhiG family RNA polymerase sigma factor n=1 Tax=Acididesulfobacillus acetoxydans TaxID=1561005 RepID=UPI001F1126AC|nr:FliA/WhiG family RNA polymerase sigma factor [Acididesulfobacillus acetoxydans]
MQNSREPGVNGQWDVHRIERFLPLVKRVAGRLAMSLPVYVDQDDMVGYGVFGLLDAVERFDPARGVKFETYATLRIRGAILDGLRAMDWVPHSARQKVRRVQDAFAALEGELGRAATPKEVAAFLKMGITDLESVLKQGQMLVLLSFDEILENHEGEGAPVVSLEDPGAQKAYEEVEKEELARLLAEAIERLPEKEKLVIALYYREELTLKEIATVMNLSEGRISQIHSQAIARLRGKMIRRTGPKAKV